MCIRDSLDGIEKIKKEHQHLVETVQTTSETKKEPAINKPASKEETKTKETKIQETPASSFAFKVIAGSFSKPEEAKTLSEQLKKHRFDTFIWTDNQENTVVYRVQAGAFRDYQSAITFSKSIEKAGINPFVLKR